MSVRKIFWEDPYLSSIKAKITDVKDNAVTLDQTVAFAFSGGQQSDFGTIEGYRIIEARKDGLEIYYSIEDGHELIAGQEVTVAIDWEKRYRIMRLHFAAEIVLELVYQNYGKPEKIGANITFEKSRVDFYWEGNISDIFPDLAHKAQMIIDSDSPIECGFEDMEKQKRYWKLEGFAKVPCGGTHVKKTGEVGTIAFKRKNIGKGKERIEIYLK